MSSPNKPTGLRLLIEAAAFDKFLFMRDHRNFEVTMFGITKKDNPLHVIDFELVKQEVNATSSDCCPKYMAEFVEAKAIEGIAPINCERVWCHTHPMTGEGSANPSGKDMATWKDPDNQYKNFLVMMILSRSGQMTCKLIIRGNWNTTVQGMNEPFFYESDIPVVINKSDEYKESLKQKLIGLYTEQVVNRLGDKALDVLMPITKPIELYPEFSELVKKYDELVTPEKPKAYIHPQHSNYHQHGGGTYVPNPNRIGYDYQNNNNTTRKKKEASARNFPEMMLAISEHKITTAVMSHADLDKIKERFNGIETIEDVKVFEKEFFKSNPTDRRDQISVLLGAVSGGILDYADSSSSKLYIKHKTNDIYARSEACNAAGMVYSVFKEIAIDINMAKIIKD